MTSIVRNTTNDRGCLIEIYIEYAQNLGIAEKGYCALKQYRKHP